MTQPLVSFFGLLLMAFGLFSILFGALAYKFGSGGSKKIGLIVIATGAVISVFFLLNEFVTVMVEPIKEIALVNSVVAVFGTIIGLGISMGVFIFSIIKAS